MLDLDSLAERQARLLEQETEIWKDAVWSPGFQTLSREMSDSDVEDFLALCPSAEHFHLLVRYLESNSAMSTGAPLAIIHDEAAKAGVSAQDWVAVLPRANGF